MTFDTIMTQRIWKERVKIRKTWLMTKKRSSEFLDVKMKIFSPQNVIQKSWVRRKNFRPPNSAPGLRRWRWLKKVIRNFGRENGNSFGNLGLRKFFPSPQTRRQVSAYTSTSSSSGSPPNHTIVHCRSICFLIKTSSCYCCSDVAHMTSSMLDANATKRRKMSR